MTEVTRPPDASGDATSPVATTPEGRLSVRCLVAALVIAVQVVMLGVAHHTDLRYFTWAPHDQQAAYEISVTLDGRMLTEPQVLDRYGISRGVDPRALSHVLNVVEQYERTYGAGQGAEVIVRYSVNGGPIEEWRWP